MPQITVDIPADLVPVIERISPGPDLAAAVGRLLSWFSAEYKRSPMMRMAVDRAKIK